MHSFPLFKTRRIFPAWLRTKIQFQNVYQSSIQFSQEKNDFLMLYMCPHSKITAQTGEPRQPSKTGLFTAQTNWSFSIQVCWKTTECQTQPVTREHRNSPVPLFSQLLGDTCTFAARTWAEIYPAMYLKWYSICIQVFKRRSAHCRHSTSLQQWQVKHQTLGSLPSLAILGTSPLLSAPTSPPEKWYSFINLYSYTEVSSCRLELGSHFPFWGEGLGCFFFSWGGPDESPWPSLTRKL